MHQQSFQGSFLVFFTIFVSVFSPLTISAERNLFDDIQMGLTLAGRVFGFDPASRVANLVSSAFSQQFGPTTTPEPHNLKRQHQHHEHELEDDRPNLNNFDASQSDANDNENENVTEGINAEKPVGTEPTANGYGIVKNVLKVFGMDTSKIGAIAINLIIFLAQMIGSSLSGTQENPTFSDNKRERKIDFDNIFDWTMQKQTKNNELSSHLDIIHDRDLMDRAMQTIDSDDTNPSTACIKLLMCITEPIVWGMQHSIADNEDEKNEDAQDTHGIKAFFKHMPKLETFKEHKDKCSYRFKTCQLK